MQPIKDVLQADYCARMLQVLADPERLLIIQSLRESEKNVGELCESVKRKIGSVSHHLKILREAGIVEAQREGRYVRYRLATNVFIPGETGNVDHLDIGCCQIKIPKPEKAL